MNIDVSRLYSPKDVIVKNGGIIPMSLSAVYAAFNRGEIPFKKIGERYFIPGYYLQSLTAQDNDQ